MDDTSSFAAAIEASERLPIVVAARGPAPEAATLFVLCAYPRETIERNAGWLVRLTSRVLDIATRGRDHRIVHRDHYANPRPLPYLLGLVRRFMREAGLRHSPDLVVDSAFSDSALIDRTAFGRVEVVDLADLQRSELIAKASSRGYDAVVVIWPDALGLGCEALQRWAARLPGAVAMNGRRRVFPLDGQTRRALRVRQFFAHTRLAEAIFALCVYPVAAFFALVDSVRRT